MSHGRFKNPVEATLTGIKDIFGKQVLTDRLTPDLRLDGKTCLVTGASSGLGFSVAAQLAERGARVLTVSRSGVPEIAERIRARAPNADVEMFRTDLSDLTQTAALAADLAKRGEKLDVVIDNAGVATPRSRQTAQGLDAMFATNYVAKFVLLTRLLRSGVIPNRTFHGTRDAAAAPARIVLVSSDSHRGASAIDWPEFGRYESYGVNKGINHYSYFKLILNTFGAELARRLAPNGSIDVATHVLCPGPVDSNIARDAPAALKVFMKVIFKLFFRSPEVAAGPAVLLATDPEFARETGRYLHMFNPKTMDPKCYDEAEGARLWSATEALLERHGIT